MIMSFVATQVSSSLVPCAKDDRSDWSQTFYRGVAFPTFARVLLLGKSKLTPFFYLCYG